MFVKCIYSHSHLIILCQRKNILKQIGKQKRMTEEILELMDKTREHKGRQQKMQTLQITNFIEDDKER